MRNIFPYLRVTLAVFIVFLHIAPSETYALEKDVFAKIKESDQPVVVKGDKVEYFHEENRVVGSGNISITYGDIKLSCDKITVYTDTKEAICEGNVAISQPGALMKGDKINYNFSAKKGYALDSKIKVHPFYGGAQKVEQTTDKEFRLQNGYITTSDLEKPHYRIQAREVQIFLDRKIIAKHTFFYIGNTPVLYLPYYVQPLVQKRPDVTVVAGRSSDWGYYGLTAWRYYFNESSKGEVHLDYREKKGFAEGIDYNYKLKGLGEGMARFYYAHENDDLAFTKTGSKDDRWRVQYRHNIDLPENTSCVIEINKLSDRDIIKDYFYREYEENPTPDNYVLFTNTMPNYTLTLLGRKRLDTFFTVAERLPELSLDVNNQKLWDTNFYYRSESSITNFIKRYDESTGISPEESLRSDNYHRLSYVTKLFKFLYTTPFIATRQTYYSRNRWKETNRLRSIYEAGVDFSTKFYRALDISTDFLNLDIHRLRHIITPTVGFLYRHQPTIAPENLYQFDEIDNIDKYNGFNLALENKIQTKRPTADGVKTVDLATFIVSTDYTFRWQKNSLEPKDDGRFGDVLFNLEVTPYSWLSIIGDMTLDHKDHNVNSANIDVYADLGKKLTIGAGHRYESSEGEKTSQLTGEIFYNINEEWKVKIYERYDFQSEKWEEQEYTIFKDLHSWIAEATLNIRDGDYTVWLVFKLKAFPELPIGLFRTTYRRPQPGTRR
ncbi:MAG: LPS-assembly protein LptD [Candidatus Omnitrophica bacterium]|nr:LPS-assembly protein LptD [Candidatus Omnitrophota bacterium]